MRPLPCVALACLLFPLLLAAPARAVQLSIDPNASSISGSGGSVSLSGTIQVGLGAPLPIASNTSFDVTDLAASGDDGSTITLDPSLQNPAAGVLSPSGAFLIPNLFLQIDDGVSLFELTVPNVAGLFGDLTGCPTGLCLETSFQIDTQGPSGVLTVQLFAVPEPGTLALLACGLAGLAGARRARAAQRGVSLEARVRSARRAQGVSR